MAFQIIRHAFAMILGNLGQALRVSVGPYVLWTIVFEGSFSLGVIESMRINPTMFLVVPLLIIFTLFVFGWVAVSWHRFILLEEYSGMLPAVSGRPIGPYIRYSLLCGLLLIAVAFPVVFLLGPLAASFADDVTLLILDSISVIVGAAFTFFWFRIALALPSIAVGKPISLGTAWSASSRFAGTIFGMAILLMLIDWTAGLLIDQTYQLVPVLGFVMNIVVQWILFMLGVSILTTLYGHLIEKRALI